MILWLLFLHGQIWSAPFTAWTTVHSNPQATSSQCLCKYFWKRNGKKVNQWANRPTSSALVMAHIYLKLKLKISSLIIHHESNRNCFSKWFHFIKILYSPTCLQTRFLITMQFDTKQSHNVFYNVQLLSLYDFFCTSMILQGEVCFPRINCWHGWLFTLHVILISWLHVSVIYLDIQDVNADGTLSDLSLMFSLRIWHVDI